MTVDRYLETRLAEANERVEFDRLHRDYALNFAELLPTHRAARIIDVGCGPGYFLDWLATLGYTDLEGIDVSADCVAAVEARHRVEHVPDTRSFLSERPRHFELIVLRNVIAHLPLHDTIPILSAAHDALTPGGLLLVETFNGALPTAEYTLSNDFTHQRMFTEASLRQVLRLANFSDPEVRPMRTASTGYRSVVYRGLRSAYTGWLRLKFVLERGDGNNPTIFEKSLLAIATKRT